MLIGLLAKKRCGKDTVADFLVKDHGFTKLYVADPLKNATRVLFGFTDEQLYGDLKETVDEFWGVTPREVFQYLGTDVFRNSFKTVAPHLENNFWVKSLEHSLKDKLNQRYVVADVRFQNEVDMIHKLGGKVFKIERDVQSNDSHESETTIDDVKFYDDVINNNASLEELYDIVNSVALKHIENFIVKQ